MAIPRVESSDQEKSMAGRGPQSFKKRQKERQRKEKQLEKAQKRVERKGQPKEEEELVVLDGPLQFCPGFMPDDPDETDDVDSQPTPQRAVSEGISRLTRPGKAFGSRPSPIFSSTSFLQR